MAFWSSFSFQNIFNLVNSNLESFHDLVMVWLTIILIVVLILGYSIFIKKTVFFMNLDSMVLEVIWTVLPILILVSIAFPSISLLCKQDFVAKTPGLSLKLMSNQWNWQSDQCEEIDHLVDSVKLDDSCNYFNPVTLPLKVYCRIFLSSSDVLHSLGIPSFGIKLDSIPGRLNAITFESFMMGLFTGSCYELCGSGHSAMPIFLFVF